METSRVSKESSLPQKRTHEVSGAHSSHIPALHGIDLFVIGILTCHYSDTIRSANEYVDTRNGFFDELEETCGCVDEEFAGEDVCIVTRGRFYW